MPAFELLGEPEAESRILMDRSCGYWVTLAGRPTLTPAPQAIEDGPRYDALVQLADVRAEHGFRVDEVPASMPANVLAAALATAYAKNRALGVAKVLPIGKRLLATGAVAGAQSQYRLRGPDRDNIEQIWVVLRAARDGYWTLYHTTRINLSEVNTIKWTHLRATSIDQHRWDGGPPATAPNIWPSSLLALPSAKLDLTELEWVEAARKAGDIGPIDDGENQRLVEMLVSIARTDEPPAFVFPRELIQIHAGQIQRSASPHIAEVLLRNVDQCQTMLDLRAWAWECVWAIGNSRSTTLKPAR